jgi:hypothetical protein
MNVFSSKCSLTLAFYMKRFVIHEISLHYDYVQLQCSKIASSSQIPVFVINASKSRVKFTKIVPRKDVYVQDVVRQVHMLVVRQRSTSLSAIDQARARRICAGSNVIVLACIGVMFSKPTSDNASCVRSERSKQEKEVSAVRAFGSVVDDASGCELRADI